MTLNSLCWKNEAPWLVGVVMGLIGLWWRGYAFVPLPYIASYDWMEYVPSAWMVAHGVDVGGYATWRNPLYPGILGHLGEWIGYNEASWLIASVAMSLTVFAAGLGARALANPWAGLVAAVTIPFINPWAEASRWATLYPLLTACTGLSLACGAALVRWGHPAWAVAAGLFAGVGWGVDFRGLALVTAVIALAAVAASERIRRTAIIGLAAALFVGPVANHAFQITDQKGTDVQVSTQRELELKLAVESGDPDLVAACTGEVADSAYPTLSTLGRPCTWAFIRDNLDRFKDQAPFGVGMTLWLLPLVVLPAGRGWRHAASGLLVFGAAWGALFIMGTWARLNVHHFVQFAAPIAMTVPVAAARLLETLLRAPRMRTGAMMLASIAGLFFVTMRGPWAGQPVTDLSRAEQHQLLGTMLTAVEQWVGPEDVLLDCTGLGVEAALLPQRLHSGIPNFQPSMQADVCQRWMAQPEEHGGNAWLLTRQEPGGIQPPAQQWMQAQAWTDGPRRTWLWRFVDTGSERP